MSVSPPPEPHEIRGKTLTPVSPKPVHYPSPSNVPILEKQMEPSFEASAASSLLMSAAGLAPMSANSNINAPAHQERSDAALQGDAGTVRDGSKAEASNGHSEPNQLTSTEDHTLSSNLVSQPIHSSEYLPGEAPTSASALGGAASMINPSLHPTLNANAFERRDDPSPKDPPEAIQANPAPEAVAPASDTNVGSVDFQSLLAQLSQTSNLPPADVSRGPAPDAPLNDAQYAAAQSNAFLGNVGLPPRPPPQDIPATHPNYNPTDDIRSYHPHSQQNLAASYRAQNSPQALDTTAPGMSPPAPPFQQTPNSAFPPGQSPITPSSYRQRDSIEPRPTSAGSQEQSAGEVERIYAQFLRDESANVAEGRWEKFPQGSRLFVGNLPTEKVTKRDLFDRFYRYGRLAQISIKQAFGFVQFLDADACHRALNGEQGVTVAGRKMHLEISKPQRNTNKGSNRDSGRRRSRSPDYNRGGQRGADRYSSGGGSGSPRDQHFRRGRDDYRPGRSPSPDRHGRGRDRHDRRRRSPSPRDWQGSSNNFNTYDESTLPIPRRAYPDVPDVEILCFDNDRSFAGSIENDFRIAGLHAHTLMVDPSWPEDVVERRQIVEGVRAVAKIPKGGMGLIHNGKISLKIFQRDPHSGSVRFDEYKDLPANIAAQLVAQAKNSAQPPATYNPPPPGYGALMPAYGYATQPAPPALPQTQTHAPPPPDLSRLLSSLGSSGNATIQNYLNTAQQSQGGGQPALTPELAALLGQLSQQAGVPNPANPSTAPGWAQQPANDQYGNVAGSNGLNFGATNPASANPTTSQARPGSQQTNQGGSAAGQPDMQEMLNQLAQYSR